jgi:hypothetical protein
MDDLGPPTRTQDPDLTPTVERPATAVSRVGFAAETSSGNGSRPLIAK